MPSRTHGVLSLAAASIALALATVIAIHRSLLLGLVYIALVAIALLVIVAVFCAKCVGRARCGHVVPGWLASVIFPTRGGGGYTSFELLLAALALVVIFAFPQAWLWRSPIALVGFWLLLALAVAEIRARVCPRCDNVRCPLQMRRSA